MVDNPDDSFFKRNPFLLNPLTAIGLKDVIDKKGTKTFIQNGGFTNVSQLLTFMVEKEYTSLHIVRKDRYVKDLKALGSNAVLNQESPDFDQKLKDFIEQHKLGVAIDCIGGYMTGKMFNNLPYGGEVVVYGMLSHEPVSGIDPVHMMFNSVSLEDSSFGITF